MNKHGVDGELLKSGLLPPIAKGDPKTVIATPHAPIRAVVTMDGAGGAVSASLTHADAWAGEPRVTGPFGSHPTDPPEARLRIDALRIVVLSPYWHLLSAADLLSVLQGLRLQHRIGNTAEGERVGDALVSPLRIVEWHQTVAADGERVELRTPGIVRLSSPIIVDLSKDGLWLEHDNIPAGPQGVDHTFALDIVAGSLTDNTAPRSPRLMGKGCGAGVSWEEWRDARLNLDAVGVPDLADLAVMTLGGPKGG